jgi:phosphinothricin acetyltransferase
VEQFVIRSVKPEDYRAVVAIYNYYIDASPCTFDTTPFSVESRSDWFAEFSDSGRSQMLVATSESQVIGYACSHLFRPKKAYETSVEVSVYIRSDVQHKGIATMLYNELFKRLEGRDVHRAYAGITLPNVASEKLHENHGFKKVGVFREVGRKFNKYWDVAWFEKPIQ